MERLIATRNLLLAPAMTKVTVALLAPTEHDDGNWSCKIEVHGLPGRQPPAAWGVDSLQAVHLAAKVAEIWLHTQPECKAGLLHYADGEAYGTHSGEPSQGER